ncbi:hypothetical protein DFJ58DRAFT_846405 [Suillus subalutaceus]|uniref:uncharacterized protein n=1 Tax=Suillus subalutaceus TaxID=48586 RepID=UPI001B85F524|nr:uncharacterized protein DFJ58DRAFT_846405 [Suillus subalutaceus]KAG1837563.1 hypothetical protein DFJ58DRAFT_846405 [Suillus subalutaceus]
MALHVPAALNTHQTSLNGQIPDENIDYDDYPEGASIPLVTDSDHPAITIVDKSGVHSLSIWYCHCPGALNQDMQLFQAGLLPAYFTRPKTAFTFSVLDDFLLDNLECGTSAMNYYSKIRRLTSSIFPLMVPDRYRELMRTARQWCQCKLYKWHGFAHKDNEPMAGDLALFCPACPQPGINLDLSTAKHLHPVNPSDEVPLMDGLAFMVGDERYKSHLSIAQDRVQKSDCNNHHAVNQANASRQKLEATGIGGCACARHGCFVPHSMVDFQKGERFSGMYMAIRTAAMSARGMGTPHRKEVLDYQMNDCNFIKMIRITKFLCRKFKEAARGAAESKLSFQNINEMAHPDMVILWEAEEALAQANRLEDPAAMDIYEVRLEKGKSPTRKQQELHLLQAQNHPDHLVTGSLSQREAATWLATGLTIEESQVSLSRDVKRLGRHPTDSQLLRVARLRDKLQTRITGFLEMAPTYLGFEVDADEPDSPVDRVHNSLDEDYSDLDDRDHNPDPEIHHASIFQPELTIIPLPSNLGMVRCKELGLTDLMKEETALHEGQANDALHAIRVHLGDKAIIFRNTVRSAKSQASSTRAWTQVRSVEKAVNLNARIYSKCRLQLVKLPDHDLLKKYLPLKKEHLKASAAVADPNARGQRDATLAWFWCMDVQGDTSGNDWMTEFYRVNWLRTKALCDRWNEEVILVKHEMQWSINFFNHKAKQWLGHKDNAVSTGLTGHACYAARQSQIYHQLAAHAADSFRKIILVTQLEGPVVRQLIVGQCIIISDMCKQSHFVLLQQHPHSLSMNNTGKLVPSDQVIIAYSDSQITAGEISRALFYANSRLLAMRLSVDKSCATGTPGYAEKFHTLMKREMEVSTWSSGHLVIRPSGHPAIRPSSHPDIPYYFNAWWQENLGSCRVSDILPKSSVQDVMELVEGHFSELPDHVETGLLPYMLECGPVHLPETIGSASLAQCRQMTIGRELLEILQGRMTNLIRSSDRLAGLIGPVDEITRAVVSSQSLMDWLNTEDSASAVRSSTI